MMMAQASRQPPPPSSYLNDLPMSRYPGGPARPVYRHQQQQPAARPGPFQFESLHMPPVGHRLSDAASAMAMDRFSVADRVAAMDRAAALSAASATLPPGYNPYYNPSPYPHHMGGGPSARGFQSMLAPHHQAAATGAGLPTPIPNTKNFPETLFDVINSDENQHIISWLPHGGGFIIHDKQRFASMILPLYFDGAKFTSFTRRLKRWSFVRVPRGPELGAYYNKNFSRDDPDLVQKMSYRIEGGQVEDAKKKRTRLAVSLHGSESEDEKKNKQQDEKKEEGDNKKLKLEIEKEVEAKFQEKEAASGEESASSHKDSELPSMQQNHINPEIKKYFVEGETPMPLPSTLPKRPSKKNGANPKKRTIKRESMSRIMSSLLPNSSSNRHANVILPKPKDNLEEQRLMEMQRELLMARSMLSHVVATGRPTGPASSSSRFIQAYHPSHPNGSSQNLLDVERAERIKRILEAERVLGITNANRSPSNPRAMAASLSNQELAMHSKIPSPSAAVRDLKSKLAPPFIQRGGENNKGSPNSLSSMSMGGHNSNGTLAKIPRGGEAQRRSINEAPYGAAARPIMMTRDEEEGFARYLFNKRNGGATAA